MESGKGIYGRRDGNGRAKAMRVLKSIGWFVLKPFMCVGVFLAAAVAAIGIVASSLGVTILVLYGEKVSKSREEA